MRVKNYKDGLAGLKIKKIRRPGLTRPTASLPDKVVEDPVVGGVIQDKRASAPEMMLAKILNKYSKAYYFRYVVPMVSGQYGLLGEKEIDFLISDGILKPVQVDDMTFVHKSPEAKEKDFESDIRVNEYLDQYGALKVIRIDAINLATYDAAFYTARMLGLI